MVGLCDCNNFFASCERVFRPELNDRPIVVLSNNDGCVIARSNEAKALGIKMGQPYFQIKDLAQRASIEVFSSNYQLYGDMSGRVFSVLRDIVPEVEIYSIDEAFIDYHGIPIEEIEPMTRNIVRYIKRSTGIPVSIGIAPTKTLAKVASKLSKSYPKLMGCCLMYREQDVEKVLSTYPVEDVWGIGRRHSKMLHSYGIRTAEQFRTLSEDWVQAKMSITGVRTHRELNLIPSHDFETVTPDKQSITVSRSFATEIYDYNTLRESVGAFMASAASKLRGQNSATSVLTVYVRTNRHRVDQPQHVDAKTKKFLKATSSTIELVAAANELLGEVFIEGYGYKKAGVILGGITLEKTIAPTLFDQEEDTKHSELMVALDSLNAKHGKDTIKLASQGNFGKNLNRNHLSPLYTTSWEDILVVKV